MPAGGELPEPASAGNPPASAQSRDAEVGTGAGAGGKLAGAPGADEGVRESVQRLQLEMLMRENAELGSKLETLTAQLRTTSELAGIDHNFESALAQSDSLDRELCAVAAAKKQQQVPRVKEVLLVFEGDLQTCCRETISAKLLHLKRLLHRRLEARLSPSPQALDALLHVLLAAQPITPPSPGERLRVQASVPLPEEARATLCREIMSVVSFTLGAKLPEEAVTFVELCPEAEEFQRPLCLQVASRLACVQVVITAFNHGTHDEIRIQDSVLSELCDADGSVSWKRLMGKYVSIGYVNKDMQRLGQDERTVVCSSSSSDKQSGSISLYYPTHLEAFFTDRALRDTLQPGALLHSLLAEHIDAIHFEEWRAGSIIVPARMAEWLAADMSMLVRTLDPWLCFLQSGPHLMAGVKIDSWSCSVTAAHRRQQERAVGDGRSASMVAVSQQATIALYFHQERQQELLRRKMVGLERILRCKHLVSHVEAHVSRLRSHAEELCGRVDWQRQDDESLRLHHVCSKLRLLSAECESSIDAAMDAIQAVSEVMQGQEGVLNAQLTKVLRARTAKQHVERLRDQAANALNRERERERERDLLGEPRGGVLGVGGPAPALGSQSLELARARDREASLGIQAAATCRGAAGATTSSPDAVSAGRVGEGAAVSLGKGVGSRGGGGVAMVKELEDGLQAHREQQEKLVRLWLDQVPFCFVLSLFVLQVRLGVGGRRPSSEAW